MWSVSKDREQSKVFLAKPGNWMGENRSMLAIELIEFLETPWFFSVEFGSQAKQTADNIF